MTEPMPIHAALAAVMDTVQAVGKDGWNDQQNFKFRGIDAVVDAVAPALRQHGVVILPQVEESRYAIVEVGHKKTPMRECTLRVRFSFLGPAGDHVDVVTMGEALDSGDKATPKAHSVALRVALLQALCIPTGDADPDAHSYERAPAQPVIETDPRWLAEMQTLADESASKDALKSVWETVTAERAAGRVSDQDASGLSKRISARLAVLDAEAAPAAGDAA